MSDTAGLRRGALEGVLRARRVLDSIGWRLHPDMRRWEAGFQRLFQRFYKGYWASAARAVGAEVEDLGGGIFRLRRGKVVTFVRGYQVQLDDHLTLRIAGDKPLTHRLLAEGGYPVPRHAEFTLSSLPVAERFLADLHGHAVVKPASGTGGGNGVTTGVGSSRSLRRAALRAAAWDRRMLIEPEIEGGSYRLLYLDGRFVDAVRRDPPSLLGDGRGTVRSLMRAETERRMTADPLVALHPLTVDLTARSTLRRQGLSLSSVPESGRHVVAKSVVNQNAARDNHCVRHEIHPSVVDTGRRIVELFGIVLGGIDILTPDIAVPLAEADGVVNEVNTTPGLHHHALVADDSSPVPVGEMVLEHLFARGQGQGSVEVPPQPTGDR
ncbi:cyanophycin synthetase [Gemmatimonadota bacterium]